MKLENGEYITSEYYIAQHFSERAQEWIPLMDTWTPYKIVAGVHIVTDAGTEIEGERAMDICISRLKRKRRKSQKFRIAMVFQVKKPVKEISKSEIIGDDRNGR